MTKPRLYTGMQPSAGSLHLGNYLGALKPAINLQHNYDSYYTIVDLHAITTPQNPTLLRQQTRTLAAQYIAAGINPDHSTLYIQSHVPAHTQLAWILNTITGYGEASRMTQFKDKSLKQGTENTTVGLFTYPILMAADILLFQTNIVPVGDDQTQHLQLTRDLAERFNKRYGNTFTIPEPVTPTSGARIYDLQNPTSKMSKSADTDKGLINLLDTPEQIVKKVRTAVTDTEGSIRADRDTKPGITNLLNILSSITGTSVTTLEQEHSGQGYGAFKNTVADAIITALTPIREHTLQLLDDPTELDRLLAVNADKANTVANHTLHQAMTAIGLR